MSSPSQATRNQTVQKLIDNLVEDIDYEMRLTDDLVFFEARAVQKALEKAYEAGVLDTLEHS